MPTLYVARVDFSSAVRLLYKLCCCLGVVLYTVWLENSMDIGDVSRPASRRLKSTRLAKTDITVAKPIGASSSPNYYKYQIYKQFNLNWLLTGPNLQKSKQVR